MQSNAIFISAVHLELRILQKQVIGFVVFRLDLENLEIRDTTKNELILEYYTEKLSEIHPNVFISGDTVARNEELLRSIGITHIINCAGNVCENYFPEDFYYIKYFMKDSNNYNIESLFYPTFIFMKNALKSGNKILIHCVQGASRSVSLCLGYIIFVKNISYEDALLKAKEIRQICSPNIGFQVQLMW